MLGIANMLLNGLIWLMIATLGMYGYYLSDDTDDTEGILLAKWMLVICGLKLVLMVALILA